MRTLADLDQLSHGVTFYDQVELDAEIPTVIMAACQGDLSILKVTTGPASTPIPPAGVAVVRGENGGHTHSLHGTGFFDWCDSSGPGDTVLGVLTVPAGGEAFLLHPEHGGLALRAGEVDVTFRIGRQREQADVVRRVAD